MASLKACFEPTELPQQGGNRPLWDCGTRLISNKVVAIGHVLHRYGAYILSSFNRTHRSLVYENFRQAKALRLCRMMRFVFYVSAIKAITKTCKAIDGIKTKLFEDLPTVKKVLTWIHFYTHVQLRMVLSIRVSH